MGVARGLMSLAPKLAPATAAAVGEGTLGAGSAMQQITEELKGVQPTPQQAGLAALTGAGTGAFGALGAKAASKLFGAADIDTMLAQGARKSATEIAEAAGKPLVKPAGLFVLLFKVKLAINSIASLAPDATLEPEVTATAAPKEPVHVVATLVWKVTPELASGEDICTAKGPQVGVLKEVS